MTNSKWLAFLPPYLAVSAGLFLFHNAWAALLGLHLSFLLALAIQKDRPSLAILLKSKNFKWVLFNLIVCGFSGVGVYYLRSIFGLSEDLPSQLAELGLTTLNLPIFIAYFSLINPFIEEYFWRAALGSDTRGFYIGDLMYAGYHGLVLFNRVSTWAVIFAMACLTFMGWAWRQIKREDGGSLAPALGHMAADFSILTAVYFIIK